MTEKGYQTETPAQLVERWQEHRAKDTLAQLAELTAAGVMFRIQNLTISGLDENGNVTYKPEVHITLGTDGSEKALFMGDDLQTEIARAYDFARENHLTGRITQELKA